MIMNGIMIYRNSIGDITAPNYIYWYDIGTKSE